MGHARPRHATTRVTAQTAARISAPQQHQLLDPGTMEREEPRDHLRSHLSGPAIHYRAQQLSEETNFGKIMSHCMRRDSGALR